MNSKYLYLYVIKPVLSALNIPNGANLLLGTAAVESGMGMYFKQINGPALSPWQIESKTAYDIEYRYLPEFKPDLVPILDGLKLKNQTFFITELSIESQSKNLELYGNLYYACAIARLLYLSKPEQLPDEEDVEGMASYWKKYYNTKLGRGYEKDFIYAFERLVKFNDLHDK
jgi:hypothetical protein